MILTVCVTLNLTIFLDSQYFSYKNHFDDKMDDIVSL